MSGNSKLDYIKKCFSKYGVMYVNVSEDDVSSVYDILIGDRFMIDEKFDLFIGIYYDSYGRNKEVDAYLLRAIKNGNLDAMVVYGYICENRGMYVEAEEYYMMGRDSINAENLLGQLYKKKGFYDEAEKFYLRSIEKGNIPAINNIAYLYDNCKKDVGKAEKFYLMGIGSGDTYAMENYGILLGKMGDKVKADKYFMMAFEKGATRHIDYFIDILSKKDNNIDLLRIYKKLYKISKDDRFLRGFKKCISEIDVDVLFNLVGDDKNELINTTISVVPVVQTPAVPAVPVVQTPAVPVVQTPAVPVVQTEPVIQTPVVPSQSGQSVPEVQDGYEFL